MRFDDMRWDDMFSSDSESFSRQALHPWVPHLTDVLLKTTRLHHDSQTPLSEKAMSCALINLEVVRAFRTSEKLDE